MRILVFLTISALLSTFWQPLHAQQNESSAVMDFWICPGDSIQLSAAEAVSYTWSPTENLSDSTIGNPFASPLETTIYTVTAIDDLGAEFNETFTVNVINQANFTAGNNQTVCQGSEVVLGGEPIPGMTYTWTPDQFINFTDIPNPSVFPEETITYTVIAENENCSVQDDVTITVTPFEVAIDVILFPQCDQVEVQLVNNSDAGNIQWDFWDGSTSTENNPTAMAGYNEVNFVTLRINIPGCNYVETIEVNTSNIEDQFIPEATNVMTPNHDGINDYFEIGIEGNMRDCMVFEVFNRWGERVFTSFAGETQWDGYTIGGQRVAQGAYFYVITINDIRYQGDIQVIY